VILRRSSAHGNAGADPDESRDASELRPPTGFFACSGAIFRIAPGDHETADATLAWTINRQNAPEGVVQVAGGNNNEGMTVTVCIGLLRLRG
jgi:hypothetical protein